MPITQIRHVVKQPLLDTNLESAGYGERGKLYYAAEFRYHERVTARRKREALTIEGSSRRNFHIVSKLEILHKR